MRRRWAGRANRPRDTLPESLTRFVSDAPAGSRSSQDAENGAGWMAAPLRDIAMALLVAVIVAAAGGRILQAW